MVGIFKASVLHLFVKTPLYVRKYRDSIMVNKSKRSGTRQFQSNIYHDISDIIDALVRHESCTKLFTLYIKALMDNRISRKISHI